MNWEDLKKVLISVQKVCIDLRDFGNHMSKDTVRMMANDITSRIGYVIMEVEDQLKSEVVA